MIIVFVFVLLNAHASVVIDNIANIDACQALQAEFGGQGKCLRVQKRPV